MLLRGYLSTSETNFQPGELKTKDKGDWQAEPFSGTFQTRWRGPKRPGRPLRWRLLSSAVPGRLSSAGGRASARIPRY